MKKILRFIANLLFIGLSFLVLFSYAMFQGGFVSWFLFYSFLPILIYHLILLFVPLQKWNVSREINHRHLQAGDTVHGNVIVERKTRFPIYYLFLEEQLPSTLNRKHRKKEQLALLNESKHATVKRTVKEIVPVGLRKRIVIPYTLEDLPRGVHDLHEIRIVISDVFGFVKKEHTFFIKDELMVEPNVWDIRFVDKTASLSQGKVSVSHFPLEQTNTVTGVREYAPGDQFSWVDWKQTAKKQTIMTKEFEQERSEQLLLVLNASLSNQRYPYAFEASIELAVSLLAKIVKTPRGVELLTLGKEVRKFDLKATPLVQREVKHHLTKLQPGGEKSFSSRLDELLEHPLSTQEMVIFTTEIDANFLSVTKKLSFRRIHLVVFYFQESNFITNKEKKWMEKMKNDGIALHVLTEKDWDMEPLEVSMQ